MRTFTPSLLSLVLLVLLGSRAPAQLNITEFPVADLDGADSSICAGPDGNLWFAAGAKIGRVTPTGSVTLFVATTDLNLRSIAGITAGPDGNVWFTLPGNANVDFIGRITPTGDVTLFPIPYVGFDSSVPFKITSGPDGNLWFTEYDANRVGRITPTGDVTEFELEHCPPYLNYPCFPSGIAVGPDGNLWVAEPHNAYTKIVRITPAGTITQFPAPVDTEPRDITKGPDGNLWFNEVSFLFGKKLGRITPAGDIMEIPVSAAPVALSEGPNGTLWFTQQSGFGRFTLGAGITEFDLGFGGYGDIVLGADGNLWFTASAPGRVGRISVPCGNGATDAGEACDDGNGINGDGCDNNCTVTGCGNGVVTSGEECDDGNLAAGDCCSTSCTIEVGAAGNGKFCETDCSYPDTCDELGDCFPNDKTAGTPCSDEGNICTQDACDDRGVCIHNGVPAIGCRTAQKSTLVIKTNPDFTADVLTWKWVKGAETGLEEFGLPTDSTSYSLCLYTNYGNNDDRAQIVLPPGSNWRPLSKGFQFEDPSGPPDGVQKAVLKSGAAGKSKVLVKGKGTSLPEMQPIPELWSLPVTVQLVNDTNATCFEAVFDSGEVTRQDQTAFKAKGR